MALSPCSVYIIPASCSRAPNTEYTITQQNINYKQVSKLTDDSITFSITDVANSSLGMPGTVEASVTYSVSDSKWDIVMEATSPEAKTRM